MRWFPLALAFLAIPPGSPYAQEAPKPFDLDKALKNLATGQNRSFIASCRDKNTHGFRRTIDVENPRQQSDDWTTDEKFVLGGPWDFKYDARLRSMTLDGKKIAVIADDPPVLAAMETTPNGLWSYAFNLSMKQAVGAQVMAYGFDPPHGGDHVKTRAIAFDCTFKFLED